MPRADTVYHKFTSALVTCTILGLLGVVVVLAIAPGCNQDENLAPGAAPPQSDTRSAPGVTPAAEPADSDQDYMHIVGSIPLEREPFQGRFTAFFDSDLAWPEGSSREPFRIEPALQGNYRVGGNFVSFTSFEGTSAPVYHITFDPELRSLDGKSLPPEEQTLALSPFEFKPDNVWELERSEERVLVGLNFPTAVSQESLNQHLTVTNPEGESVPVEITPGEGGNLWRISIPNPGQLPVRLAVSEGLTDITNSLVLAEQHHFIFPPDQQLTVRYVGWSLFNDEAKEMALAFSDTVIVEQLRTHLQVKDTNSGDDVVYEVQELARPGVYAVRLADNPTVEAGVHVTVDVGLVSQKRLLMAGPYNADLPNPLAGPERIVRVTRAHWGEMSSGEQEILIDFNTHVPASELESLLSVADAETGSAISFEMKSEGMSDRHVIRTQVESPQAVQAQVTVEPGLVGQGYLAMQEPYTHTVQHEAAPLLFEYTWWDYVGREGLALVVNMNQRPDLDSLKEHLSVDPAIGDIEIDRRYGSQFRVFGNWKADTTYTIRLSAGLTYGGATLDNDMTYVVESNEIPAYIGFGQQGLYYFPRRDGLTLPIESRNLNDAKVVLYEMFPSNVAIAVADLNAGEGNFTFREKWSRQIAEKDVELRSKRGDLAQTPLNLDDVIPQGSRGVYMLHVQSDQSQDDVYSGEGEDGGYYDRGGVQGTKIILFTNIGLLSHWTDDQLVLFAHNLYSLAPLPGAMVSVYSSKNQMMGQAATDEQGMVRFEEFDTDLGTPAVAVVEHENDHTFLELQPRNDGNGAIDASMPKYDREGYDAFLYADRDLYRPGEMVHLRWTVRTNYGDAVEGVPFLIEIIKPDGETLSEETSAMSEFGTGGMDLETQQTYATGAYTAQLKVPGSTTILGKYTFKLEDFVPDRMKATIDLPEKRWVSGRQYTFTVYAEHLFGGAAQGRRTEGEVILRRGTFKPENWKQYTFNNDAEYKPKLVPLGEGETDEEGKVIFNYTPRTTSDVTFPLEATVQAGVYEVGGRAVVGRETAILFPSPIALGVAVSPRDSNDGVEAHVAAITIDEQPADVASVQVALEKQVWNYYLRRYMSHNAPNWTQSWEPVEEPKTVALKDGRGTLAFDISDWGYYRVKVSSDQTSQYSTQAFYSYGGRAQAVDKIEPSLINVVAAQKSYAVGEAVLAKVESPFDGQGIVVVQGDSLQQMIPVTISGGVGEVTFEATADMFPNVWIEATVIHAIDTEHRKLYPFSSFDMTNVKVHDPLRQLVVSMPELPEEMRPQKELTVTLQVLNDAGEGVEAEVTLAAVDEGIHSITNYQNPDPYEWLRRPRSPDVRRAHYYDKVAYDFESPAPGGDLGLAKRVATVDETWIKPLALWSGAVVTDANGVATVTFQVPEFSGQIRLVAVAVSTNAVGAGAASMYVRRPYVLRTSMPRFMLPNDHAICSATVFNRSKEPVTAELSWSVDGPLSTEGSPQTLELAAGGEASLTASFTAAEAVGQAEIRWQVVVRNADGAEVDRMEEVAPMPVRPPAAYQSDNQYVALDPGQGREFANELFLNDGRLELSLSVSANPMLRVQDALRYLVGYPYGCIEQVTSRLFPMYLFAKASDMAPAVLPEDMNVDYYIQGGIQRLFSMQTPSGGLGYWPGAVQPAPYSSVYALHFLTLVKNGREYDVPEEDYANLVEYVKTLANDWSATNMSIMYQRAYATFVLAIGGDLDSIEQIQRFDAVTIPRAARYLLAAALAQVTADQDRVKMYLQTAPMQPFNDREMSGTFNSAIRNEAVELLALMQMGADATQVAEKAKQLMAFLENNRWGTTQETAFIVSALSTYLAKIADKPETASGIVRGPNGETTIAGFEVHKSVHKGPGGVFTVQNTGEKPLYVSFTSAGIPEDTGLPAESHGLVVGRKFYTSTGETHTGSDFEAGRTYIVELTVTPEQPVENLLVVDLLPAGFEIENPRLRDSVMPQNLAKDQATPSYVDVRDDRLVLAYDTLSAHQWHFYYVVRAVTPGTYQHPPLQSEVMYDPAILARTESGNVEVVARE